MNNSQPHSVSAHETQLDSNPSYVQMSHPDMRHLHSGESLKEMELRELSNRGRDVSNRGGRPKGSPSPILDQNENQGFSSREDPNLGTLNTLASNPTSHVPHILQPLQER